MDYSFQGGDAFSIVKVELDAGETIKAESNAMVAMSTSLQLKGKVDGGFLRGLARKFSGESFFMQEIKAKKTPGWVMLASGKPGDSVAVELDGLEDLYVERGGFLAATENIQTSTKTQSLTKGLFSREGFFVVKLSGKGTAFLSCYGSIMEIELGDGEETLIDNGHLVAWESSMSYNIVKGAEGFISSLTSGEVFALKFTGPGTIYIQTRNPWAFGAWARPFMNIPRSGNN